MTTFIGFLTLIAFIVVTFYSITTILYLASKNLFSENEELDK